MTWKDQHLYVGRIWIGYVSRPVPEGWRGWPDIKTGPPADAPDYMKRNHANSIAYKEQHDAKPWRAWISSSEDGDELGWYETAEEATAALERVALDSIMSS